MSEFLSTKKLIGKTWNKFSSKPGFAIMDIPNILAWFRADLGVTLNGSNVSAWADQSGNAHNFLQGSVPNQPLFNASDAFFGGKPSIQSDTTLKWLRAGITTTASFTIFAVAKSDLGMGAVLASDSSNNWYLEDTGATGLRMVTWGAPNIVNGGRIDLQPASVIATHDASGLVAINTNTPITGNLTGPNTNLIDILNSANHNQGSNRIAEFAMWSGTLTHADIVNLNNYAAIYYGLTVIP